MKQILQHLGNGETELADVPAPKAGQGQVLIRTQASLLSLGTERMLVDFGKANLISKARQQPDKVRQVIDKARTDGVRPTLEAVRDKLDKPIPLGYCNAGICIEVGEGVRDIKPGDRVVSNGSHAEVVSVPQNLCAKIPEQVTMEEASFTVAASIALQGIRLVNPTLGETVVVTGLGLMGLLAVQLLRANGCRVIGIDLSEEKCRLAGELGAETVRVREGTDPVQVVHSLTQQRGADAVLIMASTQSSEPARQAAQMCRKRGRVVLTGVTGLELSRDDFYEKEISFQVSCSYGPGRYDRSYEDEGHDYPLGFVRWTEQRNFEAALQLMASGKLQLQPLISKRFPFSEALEAYAQLDDRANLGLLLNYPEHQADAPVDGLLERRASLRTTTGKAEDAVAFIGAGGFTSKVLLPAFAEAGANLHTIVSRQGVSARHLGKKFDFAEAASDPEAVLSNDAVKTVVIATPHHTHAGFVMKALRAGKHVFVEKPLCLHESELDEIETLYRELPEARRPQLMVGFNRRFAPLIEVISGEVREATEPRSFIYTINAGAIPADHWTQDRKTGGGRLLGEGCHFIDLLRFLANSPITNLSAQAMQTGATHPPDTFHLTFQFADGSTGVVHYLANGDKSFPKERLEVFCGGRILQLDNFRKLHTYGWKGLPRKKSGGQDKGHKAEVKAFIEGLKEGRAPIPFDEIIEVSRATLEAQNKLDSK